MPSPVQQLRSALRYHNKLHRPYIFSEPALQNLQNPFVADPDRSAFYSNIRPGRLPVYNPL